MSERNGVEIDYCPKCRGVWLDRGELDKILERSAEHYSRKESFEEDRRKYDHDDDRRKYDDDRHRHSGDYQGHHPHRKKKSFLSEFLDFD